MLFEGDGMLCLRVCFVAPLRKRCVYVRDFLLKVGLWNGFDMEVMSGIYDFLYAALLSQGRGIEGC